MSIHWFEYYRALGHIWYLHPLFWWYSSFYYGVSLWVELKSGVPGPALKFLAICLMLQVVLCVILGVLACVQPKDAHFERRDYINISDRNLSVNFVYDESRQASFTGDFGPCPVFVTNVSGQINFNQKQKKVHFEIVTKISGQQGPAKFTTQRTYDDFARLEQQLISTADINVSLRGQLMQSTTDLNKVGEMREELNDFLKQAIYEQARANNGFLPNNLLEFLGCTAEYIDTYEELQYHSQPEFKESIHVPWQIPETGDPQADTKRAICSILSKDRLEFAVEVLLRQEQF